MGVSKFERFFRAAAGLDVDKNDLKRYDDFVNRKIYDLFLIAQAVARANGRDVVEPQDLPIGKGLQECIHAFRGIDEEIELQPLLDQLTAEPAVDLAAAEETRPPAAHRRRTERGARAHLPDPAARAAQPADRRVGAGHRRLRPAVVTSTDDWTPQSSGVTGIRPTGAKPAGRIPASSPVETVGTLHAGLILTWRAVSLRPLIRRTIFSDMPPR
jgi:hypothetical protein